ncbi:autotransporter assembly complex protein TamA [Marinobacter salsuginis]|uniref:autotransporter assembly complex protein TamA n=1 Tax=Marinobacter salsuginis TaxID=418719 RepID=UPI001D19616C|nr:POTRA domain-containing protein [Marinobacter salsuginis]
MEGDYPELKSNAEAFIGEVEGRSTGNLRRYAPTAVNQAREALRALGYYGPVIDWRIEGGDSDTTATLTLSITPGEPVTVRSRTVEMRGAAATDPRLTSDLPVHPAEGDILDHGEYANLRNTIQNRARRRGYFDGKFVTRTLEVDPTKRIADITLIYESGERYRLGQVTFEEGHWFEIDLLKNFVTFEPGTPYHADEIARLNKDLLNSGYFSNVDINISPQAAENGVIPVSVGLSRREARSVAAGVGFSTDVGPRFRGPGVSMD